LIEELITAYTRWQKFDVTLIICCNKIVPIKTTLHINLTQDKVVVCIESKISENRAS